MGKVFVVIPAYNPDKKLSELVGELVGHSLDNIICVNDGSVSESDLVFEDIKKSGVTVLIHEQNKGKGIALKTAFSYIQNICDADDSIVTVDADGQHDIDSIMNCIDALKNDNTLVLGARIIENRQDVPFRSRFGNAFTKIFTRIFCGLNLKDTQTGLRCFSCKLLPFMIDIEGDRYEYEMNVLLKSHQKGISFTEVPISVIYENDNKSSHFNPVKDSIIIYSVIFRYIGASLLSFLVEYILFMILVHNIKSIFISTYIARFFSSLVNYFLNKRVVFKSDKNAIVCLVEYYILVILSGTLSAACIKLIVGIIGGHVGIIKILVDTTIFLLNYFVQKKIIFKK